MPTLQPNQPPSLHPSQPPAARQSGDRITACLIVQNEQDHLAGALESVSFCDEALVVDGGSTDGTVEIARGAGARVIENPWPGYAAQRNVALDASDTEWVLEIDADERVSPRLRESIETLLSSASPEVEIAVCPLRNLFLGAPLDRSAKYPAYRARVFRRGAYRHDETRAVHEGVEPCERPAVLAGDLEHELAGTVGEALSDAWRYARLESQHVLPSGRSAYATGIVLRPAAKWAYRLILDAGWRDGWRGLFKLTLDSLSDALVWTLVLAGKHSEPAQATVVQAADAQAADMQDPNQQAAAVKREAHFGRRPVGPPKVVALADRGAPAQAARRWLAGLKAAGIDVALITAESRSGYDSGFGEAHLSSMETPTTEIPERSVRGLHPVAIMRALDIEMQLRTIDSVVPVGRRARLICHVLPPTLRPEIGGLTAEAGEDLAVELAYAAVSTARST
jgi:hypothetical protein